MNKTLQTIAIILSIIAFSGTYLYTSAYDDIQSSVVEVLCLSCLKLDPVLPTNIAYTFETGNAQPHPNFVLENLSTGIVFLHYSKDACAGCDVMLPTIQELFSVEYGKQDMFQQQLTFDEHLIHYHYINTDHTTEIKQTSVPIYDKEHIEGLPMFTIVTVYYDHGTIKPYYTSLYGTLGPDHDTHEKRFAYLTNIITDSITLWDENIVGYEP